MPADTAIQLVSRTLGQDQFVDEIIFSFTHTEKNAVDASWRCTNGSARRGSARGGRRLRDGKLAHEHVCWDQVSVLKQIGLLTDPWLPVFGVETAQKLLDPAMPGLQPAPIWN